MKIAIIGAMEEEVKLLRSKLTNPKTETHAGFEYYTGQIEENQIVLLRSGIGKVNAAISTTILLKHYNPDYVINTGSAGGFHTDLDVGDIVISSSVCHHDVDVTPFGYDLGQVPGMPACFAPGYKYIVLLCSRKIYDIDESRLEDFLDWRNSALTPLFDSY